MSIEVYALSDRRLASMAEWQEAIDREGFALRLYGRIRARWMGVAAVVLWLMPSLALAQMPSSLRELLVEYRCQLVDRLERIYEYGDHDSHRDRFIAVTVPQHRHGYVQCMFAERRSLLYCEASSGFYYDKQDAPRTQWLSRDKIDALGRLGFSTDDSKGNFSLERPLDRRPDFNGIADLILQALHDGYDARATSKLRFNAPFARRATSSCVPLS